METPNRGAAVPLSNSCDSCKSINSMVDQQTRGMHPEARIISSSVEVVMSEVNSGRMTDAKLCNVTKSYRPERENATRKHSRMARWAQISSASHAVCHIIIGRVILHKSMKSPDTSMLPLQLKRFCKFWKWYTFFMLVNDRLKSLQKRHFILFVCSRIFDKVISHTRMNVSLFYFRIYYSNESDNSIRFPFFFLFCVFLFFFLIHLVKLVYLFWK